MREGASPRSRPCRLGSRTHAFVEWQEFAKRVCAREGTGSILDPRTAKEMLLASILKEMRVNASVERVWDAVRDVGAIHRRLVPGFVTDCRMDGDGARVGTFGNGITVHELVVDLDDVKRRLVWSVRGGSLTHQDCFPIRSVEHSIRGN